MTALNKLLTPLFLRNKEIKKVIELLFFSYRDFIAGPDKILEKIKFGRAHHRIIYFVGKKNNITIKEIDDVVTKERFDGWQNTINGTKLIKQKLYQILYKHKLGEDDELLEKTYLYVREHY